jgi:hypothetical protein
MLLQPGWSPDSKGKRRQIYDSRAILEFKFVALCRRTAETSNPPQQALFP